MTPAYKNAIPPTIPTGFTAVAFSGSQINLSWNPSAQPNGPGVQGYVVFRQGTGQIGTTAGTTYSDTGLASATLYTYWVQAIDKNALQSAASATASATTQAIAPQVPTGVLATANSSSQITVTWNASSDPGGPGLKDYGVYRGGVLQGYINALTYIDVGLTASTLYSYQITARDVNLLESAKSAASSATTQASGTTVKHGVAITLTTTGTGTKSVSNTPAVFDYGADAPYGSTSPQWTSPSKNPVAAGGNYNIQNQPPGFSPSGAFITPVNQFVRAVIAGAHALSGNDCNSVALGFYWSPPNNGTTVTYPFCSVHEYDYCFDPNLFYNPQGDNNTKSLEYGDDKFVFPGSGQYAYYEPFPISLFPISAISQTNPCIVHCPMNQAVSPVNVGDVMTIFGAAGMTQINGPAGVSAQVTNVAGSNGNFQYTMALDTTSYSAYTAAAIQIASITNANPAVITLNSAAATHPLVERTFIWVQGAAGGTWGTSGDITHGINQGQNLCCVNLGGSPGAWTAQLINGQFAGVNVDSTSFGTYTANSGSFTTGQLSVPFSTLGQTTAQNTYINPKSFRMNPISQLQNPDAAGHGMTSLAQQQMASATGGLAIRRRVEMCWSQSATLTPGYFRIFDNNTLVFNFVGRTDNLSASTVFRHFGIGSMYQSSRGINNFAYMQNAYYDWGTSGGQVYRVYAGNASTYAACTILVPQPYMGTIANTSVPLTQFWQGSLPNSATVYFYVLPEGSTVGTAVAANGGQGYTIIPVALPSISTSSLPTAIIGAAYSTNVVASGGTAPYTYYLASAATGGGINATPANNTWAINSSTGVLTGTPSAVETDLIAVTVIDANGYNAAKLFSLVTAIAVNFDYFISTTGSDSNAGTLASPWAITAINSHRALYAGKKVGVMDGTYSVRALIQALSGDGYACALSLNGAGGTSTNPTVIQAVNRGAAIIDSGIPTVNNPTMGTNDTSTGYITIDGIKFINGGSKVIHFGTYTGSNLNIPGWTVQNCEFTGQNTSSFASGNNFSCIEPQGGLNFTSYNNYFHGNIGNVGATNGNHFTAIICWYCISSNITYNTCLGPGFYGKEGGNAGTTIAYNYVDGTGWTGVYGIQDFQGDQTTSFGVNTSFHHNVLIAPQWDCRPTLSAGPYFTDPISVYNNTVIIQASGQSLGFTAAIQTGDLSHYNNIIYNQASGDFDMVCVNVDAPGLMDYDLFYSTTTYTYGYLTSKTTSTRSGTSSFTTWKATMTGAVCETHALNATNPLLVAVGSTGASNYKLQGSSPAIGAGKSNGLVGGTACDMGAWGNGAPSAIGSSLGPQ